MLLFIGEQNYVMNLIGSLLFSLFYHISMSYNTLDFVLNTFPCGITLHISMHHSIHQKLKNSEFNFAPLKKTTIIISSIVKKKIYLL